MYRAVSSLLTKLTRRNISTNSRGTMPTNNSSNNRHSRSPRTRTNNSQSSFTDLSKTASYVASTRASRSTTRKTTANSATSRSRSRSYSAERFGFSSDHNNDSAAFNQQFHDDIIVVYTDGSCVDDRASGFGIYFGEDHPLTMSHSIRDREHNSGLAEILGATTALENLFSWGEYRSEKVVLRTDYLPLVTAMNNGNHGRFAEDYDKLREIACKFPNGVEFQHVYGHNGDPGNEKADELAGRATAWARVGRSRSMSRDRLHPRSRSRSRSRNRRARSQNPENRRRNRSVSRQRSQSLECGGQLRSAMVRGPSCDPPASGRSSQISTSSNQSTSESDLRSARTSTVSTSSTSGYETDEEPRSVDSNPRSQSWHDVQPKTRRNKRANKKSQSQKKRRISKKAFVRGGKKGN